MSVAPDLAPEDTTQIASVFVHDLTTGATSLVSVGGTGGAANNDATQPAISGDGKVVAFQSTATNLVAGDTNGSFDIFVRDLGAGTTERVSVTATGTQSNGISMSPRLSFEGRYVAFLSTGVLVSGGSGGANRKAHVRDRVGATTSWELKGGGSADANHVDISADGRYVTAALAGGLSAVRDRVAGTEHLLGRSTSDAVYWPVLSPGGRYVAVLSAAALVQDVPTGQRVFVLPNPL